MTFITNHQATVVLEPDKQTFYFPPFSKSSQDLAVLGERFITIFLMRGNQINAMFVGKICNPYISPY